MLKKEAISLAKSHGWTAKDAERAYAGLDFNKVSQEQIVDALVRFAGPELLERQRLQAAQKAQVTRKKNHIKKIEIEFNEKIEEGEKKIAEMRSTFLPLIDKIYNFAKPFGLEDPWIEALLAT